MFCNFFTQFNSYFSNCMFPTMQYFGGWGNSIFGGGFGFMPPMFNFGEFNNFNFCNNSYNLGNTSLFNYTPPNNFYNFDSFNWTDSGNNNSLYPQTFIYNGNTNYSASTTKTKTKKANHSTDTQTGKYKIGNFDLDYWKQRGYDKDKGKALADDSVRIMERKKHECVGFTRRSINNVYGTKFQNAGRACNFGTTILSQPELKGKFRKATHEEIEKGGIPNGAIMIWDGGTPGFDGDAVVRRCGHGGIYKDGGVYANGVITRHFETCKEIWIPITSV